jgi:hypothetical protein
VPSGSRPLQRSRSPKYHDYIHANSGIGPISRSSCPRDAMRMLVVILRHARTHQSGCRSQLPETARILEPSRRDPAASPWLGPASVRQRRIKVAEITVNRSLGNGMHDANWRRAKG